MANDYEDYMKEFGSYYQMKELTRRVEKEPNPSIDTKSTIKSLYGDDPFVSRMIDSVNTSEELRSIVGHSTSEKMRDLEEKVNDKGVENILKDAPNEDIELGLLLSEPRKSYSGSHKGLYKEAAKMHRGLNERRENLQKGKSDDMEKELNEYYEGKYDEDDKEVLKNIKTLYENKSPFLGLLYEGFVGEKRNEFREKLNGYEAGYIARNLEKTKDSEDNKISFTKFYETIQLQKERMREQQEKRRAT